MGGNREPRGGLRSCRQPFCKRDQPAAVFDGIKEKGVAGCVAVQAGPGAAPAARLAAKFLVPTGT